MNENREYIFPTQPFIVLETENFRQRIYGRNGISHFYQFSVPEKQVVRAVPDGCIDLIFEYTKEGMNGFEVGTVLSYEEQVWTGPKEVFGVRFFPGVQPSILKTNPGEVLQNRVPLMKMLKDKRLLPIMEAEKRFDARVRAFLHFYKEAGEEKRKPYGKKELVNSIRQLACQSGGKIKISEMSKKTGYSERYLNKVFSEAMGFSPKAFCKMMQFQCALDYLNHNTPEKMTDLAVMLGYYDQPQFIRDFKNFAGITPKRYLRMMQQEKENRRLSDQFLKIV